MKYRLKRIIIASLLIINHNIGYPKCVDRNNSTGLCREEEEIGRCLLEIGGKKYISGPCNIRISNITNTIVFEAKKKSRLNYFVYVNVDDQDYYTAQGFWNGITASGHAHDSLGTLRREGSSCWINSTSKVCAWRTYGD